MKYEIRNAKNNTIDVSAVCDCGRTLGVVAWMMRTDNALTIWHPLMSEPEYLISPHRPAQSGREAREREPKMNKKHQLPDDIKQALSIARCEPEGEERTLEQAYAESGVQVAPEIVAEAAKLAGGPLNACRPIGIKMIFDTSKNEPWWQLLCAGNPILAEDPLREAGLHQAFAGAPGKIWLRVATHEERERYEAEQDLYGIE